MAHAQSLAATAGRPAAISISLLICTSHVLFAYAQLSGTGSDCPGIGSTQAFCPEDLPNTGLVEILLRANVGYSARGLLSNGLGAVEQRLCGTSCPDAEWHTPGNSTCEELTCDECTSVGPLSTAQSCALRIEKSVMHLSYIYMIRELYTRDKDPNCYHPGDPSCTGIKPGRPATAILVASSFIWPHVKLLLLHIMFYRTLKPVNRRNRNYWLAFFGKWTLTDVLVWCACIGVFHGLSVNDSIPSLWSKVEDDALHLCASLCANKTHVSNSTCDVLCHDLTNMLDRTVLSPSELPTSNVDVHLAFRTRIGTYLFCVAVVLSLSISVLVDSLEDKLQDAEGEKQLLTQTSGMHLQQPQQPQQSSSTINTALLDTFSTSTSSPHHHSQQQPPQQPSTGRRRRRQSRMMRLVHIVAVAAQMLLTYCAVTLPLFRRVVTGGIPAALRSRGFDFDGGYTVLDLARLAASPGGWDYLLSATFWLFIVICPMLRGMSQMLLLIAPLPMHAAKALHRASRACSYYYAHEVMVVGVPLLHITIGPLTSTIFTPRVTPQCAPLMRLYNEPACFDVDVIPGVGYGFMCASVVVYLLTGFDGSFTHKWVHKGLFPEDRPPPNPPRCCRKR